MIQKLIKKTFGSANDKEIKKYKKRVKHINSLEKKYSELNDEELKFHFDTLRKEVLNGKKDLNQVLEKSFAITREASKRILNMRHFDVQLIGGMALHEGKIAEMKTGEGKTLVATLPVILNSLTGKSVHIVTVNDYLAKRDAEEMRPLYQFLGLSVGILLEQEDTNEDKSDIYNNNIVYGTNNVFGFDYLRDNMNYEKDSSIQKEHNFVIIDEIDSILIDEARTPLIISGPSNIKHNSYAKLNEVAMILEKDFHFTIDEKEQIVEITENGIGKVEELLEIDNLYSLDNAHYAHTLDQALKAHFLFLKDISYVVKDNEVIIVDEFTGRLSEGRRFSDGLHQALEAKENVEIQAESQTLASITFQNYFRMYNKLAGMTGTASTEATEFSEIYGLNVVSVPTNIPIARKDLNDLIYQTEQEKFEAVIKTVLKIHANGQPVLIGTASIDKSEILHRLLNEQNITHTVLNAKNHTAESEIIKKAGDIGAITIATNMAGRGVDIKLSDEVKAKGGLYIIGTERHENRRIDNQLRGRSGRQGDVGTTQFYLSLDDSLLRIFGANNLKSIMSKLGVEYGEFIESKMITRSMEKAQKKVEEMHYEGRKQVLEYDDIENEQRKIVYNFRKELLTSEYDINAKINEFRNGYILELFQDNYIFENMSAEDYNLDGLISSINDNFAFKFDKKELSNKDFSELFEYIQNTLTNSYNDKLSILDKEMKNDLEKDLFLKQLDMLWREHLYSMDNMKMGIRLRAYNQKDPLTEFKKESYHMFNDFLKNIKGNIIQLISKMELRLKEE